MLNTMNTNRISRMNHLFTSAFLLGISSHSWGQIITTVAGGGVGDGGPAAQANLSGPRGVAVDAAGNLYIADQDNHRVRRVDAVTGTITTVVGTGGREFSGDGGSASLPGFPSTGLAIFTSPISITTASDGSIRPPGSSLQWLARGRRASAEVRASYPAFRVMEGPLRRLN